MEKYVVSGILEQMENCFGYMTDKYAEKGYEVAKLCVGAGHELGLDVMGFLFLRR